MYLQPRLFRWEEAPALAMTQSACPTAVPPDCPGDRETVRRRGSAPPGLPD